MRPGLVALFAITATLVTGCAELTMFYRPGVSMNRMERDRAKCEVDALKQAPVATQIRRDPPEYIPSRTYCRPVSAPPPGWGSTTSAVRRGDQVCYTRPGYWISGGVYTEDPNAALRSRLTQICMADRGYTTTRLPVCSDNVARSQPQTPTRVQPELTETACYIRLPDGGIRIVP